MRSKFQINAMPDLPIYQHLPTAKRVRPMLAHRQAAYIAGGARVQELEVGGNGHGARKVGAQCDF